MDIVPFEYDINDNIFTKNVTLPVSSTCTDSDSGKNYYVKGTTRDYLNTIVEDFCFNEAILVEGFCFSQSTDHACTYGSKDSGACGIRYTCPNGCSDGACVESTTASTVTHAYWSISNAPGSVATASQDAGKPVYAQIRGANLYGTFNGKSLLIYKVGGVTPASRTFTCAQDGTTCYAQYDIPSTLTGQLYFSALDKTSSNLLITVPGTPDQTEIISLVMKFDTLKAKLVEFANKADKLAEFYTSINDAVSADKYTQVAAAFRSSVSSIDNFKTFVSANKDDITVIREMAKTIVADIQKNLDEVINTVIS